VGDVLAPEGDEGRGRLRKVRGSCQTSIEPGIPELTYDESIVVRGERGELKHLIIPSVSVIFDSFCHGHGEWSWETGNRKQI